MVKVQGTKVVIDGRDVRWLHNISLMNISIPDLFPEQRKAIYDFLGKSYRATNRIAREKKKK